MRKDIRIGRKTSPFNHRELWVDLASIDFVGTKSINTGPFSPRKRISPRAKLCLEQTRTYAENFDMPLDDVAVLFHNLSAVDLLSGHNTNNL